jgi:LPS sulfotransferase NodH
MNSIAKVLRRQVGRVVKKPGAPSWRVAVLSDDEKRSIPEADFVSAKFDRDASTPPSRMIVILSTPRSGSTYLCQLLHNAGLCTAHEYLQREHYLPLLAERWGSLDGGRVQPGRYIAALEGHRTSDSGVLGINLHGSHLQRFVAALPFCSAENVKYVWLQRRDKLRQAVSFGIAKQTGQWSSEFGRSAGKQYDFRHFSERLAMIHRHEDLVRAFIAGNEVACDQICYEDLTADPAAVVKACFDIDIAGSLSGIDRPLQKQGDATNEDFVRRLAHDLFFGTGG